MITTATELKNLLQQYNSGIQDVTIEYGIVCVYVRNAKSLTGVMCDLLRSGGFKSVKPTANCASGKGFIVHAVPAAV